MSTPRREIETHTALRGIAALMVVLGHYRVNLPSGYDVDQFTLFLSGSGSFVDMFFILSGFVIAYSYCTGPDETFPKGTTRSFLIKRIARIYPLHLFTLAAMILLLLYTNGGLTLRHWRAIIENLLMVHAWGTQSEYILNFPSWSISAEWAAYLFFPLFAAASRMRGFTLVVILACAVGYGAYWLFRTQYGWPQERFDLLRALPAFALGIAIYRHRALVTRIPDGLLSLLQWASVILLVVSLHLGVIMPFIVPIMAAIVFLTWQDRGSLASVLIHRPFLWLGLMSYTIYMLHVPVRAYGYIVWGRIVGEAWGLVSVQFLFVAVCLLATLVLSGFVFRWIEAPARRKVRALATDPGKTRAA